METEKKKSNAGVIVLIAIICLLFGAIGGYYFYGSIHVNKSNTNKGITTLPTDYVPIPDVTEPVVIDNKVYKNIGEYLTLHNISFTNIYDMKSIYSFNDYDDQNLNGDTTLFDATKRTIKYGEFKDNGKTIYLDFNNAELSLSTPVEYNDAEVINFEVYKYADYYVVINPAEAGDSKLFILFDKNLNKIYESMSEEQLYFTDSDIYYTTQDCDDDEVVNNPKKGVNKYNFDSKQDVKVFYVEHTAGWKC